MDWPNTFWNECHTLSFQILLLLTNRGILTLFIKLSKTLTAAVEKRKIYLPIKFTKSPFFIVMKFVFQLLKCIYRARNIFWSTVFEMNNHIITCLSNLSRVVNKTQTATKNSKHGRFPLEKIAVLTSDFPSESITYFHIHLAMPDLQSEVKMVQRIKRFSNKPMETHCQNFKILLSVIYRMTVLCILNSKHSRRLIWWKCSI